MIRPMRHTVYKPHERPEVEVRVDGRRHYGELRMWTQDNAGAWSAQVTWSRAVAENLIGTFAAADVRPLRALLKRLHSGPDLDVGPTEPLLAPVDREGHPAALSTQVDRLRGDGQDRGGLMRGQPHLTIVGRCPT